MDMDTGQTILTRGLPKTGQTSVILAGDDGTHQAGWWLGKKIADNRERFILKILDGEDVIIDLATGLMWPRNCRGDGAYIGERKKWPVMITYANGLTFATFSDWRMPNIFEFLTLMSYEYGVSAWPSIFSNVIGDSYWTSTRDKAQIDEAVCVSTVTLMVSRGDITLQDRNLLCVRGGL